MKFLMIILRMRVSLISMNSHELADVISFVVISAPIIVLLVIIIWQFIH